MDCKTAAKADTKRNFSAWINEKDRVISFHPEADCRPVSTCDGNRFWSAIRILVERGYRIQ